MLLKSVITSYSIHYTKLYDANPLSIPIPITNNGSIAAIVVAAAPNIMKNALLILFVTFLDSPAIVSSVITIWWSTPVLV